RIRLTAMASGQAHSSAAPLRPCRERGKALAILTPTNDSGAAVPLYPKGTETPNMAQPARGYRRALRKWTRLIRGRQLGWRRRGACFYVVTQVVTEMAAPRSLLYSSFMLALFAI